MCPRHSDNGPQFFAYSSASHVTELGLHWPKRRFAAPRPQVRERKLSAFYRARYYNQSLGRFFSRDPLFSLGSLYAYCHNSPGNYRDPLGMEGISPADGYDPTEESAYDMTSVLGRRFGAIVCLAQKYAEALVSFGHRLFGATEGAVSATEGTIDVFEGLDVVGWETDLDGHNDGWADATVVTREWYESRRLLDYGNRLDPLQGKYDKDETKTEIEGETGENDLGDLETSSGPGRT